MKIWPGTPYPLGANYDGNGTNFSIYSQVAEKVELCLFDEHGQETRIGMTERTAFCWHCYLPEVAPGQRYGYRVYGPYDPQQGVRCCGQKLLLDPYAKAIDGHVQWNETLFLYFFDNPDSKLNDLNSAPYMPKAVVTNPFFDWKEDRHPRVTLHESVIYEVHVKDFSKLHEDIPEEIRGSYEALGHPAALKHFERLGVTAVELMPVHQ